MKPRIPIAMLAASLVGFLAALVAASYVIATEPELALPWWVLVTGCCTWSLRRAVIFGAAVGTATTVVALAGRALYVFGVPAIGCICIVVAFASLVMASVLSMHSDPYD